MNFSAMSNSIRSIRRCLFLAGFITITINDVSASHSAFITHPSTSSKKTSPNRLPILHISESENSNNRLRKDGPKNESTSRNEFSRTLRVSKWFSSMGGANTSKSRNKSLNFSISATDSERMALATRFRLANITTLNADLVVSPALGLLAGGGDQDNCIQVSGTVTTKVKTTCVRTNEDFDVDMEFTFDTTLKAMAATGINSANSGGYSSGELEALATAAQFEPKRAKKKNRKQTTVKTVKGGGGQRGQEMDSMKELQNILSGYEVTNDIIEDESCFCTDGIVDVGEIVSQMFRSKLDPYPKKPGSDPVKYTFTF